MNEAVSNSDLMVELEYSVIIEAADESDYFGFYSTDLEGFNGIGHSKRKAFQFHQKAKNPK